MRPAMGRANSTSLRETTLPSLSAYTTSIRLHPKTTVLKQALSFRNPFWEIVKGKQHFSITLDM